MIEDITYQSVCALVRSSCERLRMMLPISVLAELNIEFLFFTMMSSELADASFSDKGQSKLQSKESSSHVYFLKYSKKYVIMILSILKAQRPKVWVQNTRVAIGKVLLYCSLVS